MGSQTVCLVLLACGDGADSFFSPLAFLSSLHFGLFFLCVCENCLLLLPTSLGAGVRVEGALLWRKRHPTQQQITGRIKTSTQFSGAPKSTGCSKGSSVWHAFTDSTEVKRFTLLLAPKRVGPRCQKALVSLKESYSAFFASLPCWAHVLSSFHVGKPKPVGGGVGRIATLSVLPWLGRGQWKVRTDSDLFRDYPPQRVLYLTLDT